VLYEIFLPEFFKSTVKDLKKKYPNVIQDLKTALRVVESNPELGGSLRGFGDVKKLRVRNSDVTKGKSGGYRHQKRNGTAYPVNGCLENV
jgi:mRNA-degrading endonuclease RelE of RelBE toxin-antitoxin system